MDKKKPILFFRDIEKPGTISIFATLKDAIDLVAKNKKPYLRLVLVDPNGLEKFVQIWSDYELYAPVNMFLRKNLLVPNGPIHLIDLSYDGEYISSSMETKVDAIPTEHPIYHKYIQLNNYRLQKTIPEDPAILNEIKKLLKIEPIIESILSKLKDEGVNITEQIFHEVTKLICDKTYTGTIHLISGEPQLTITDNYTNYVLKQLEILMISFEKELANSRIAPIILIRRLQKDLVSLYEFSMLHKK
ncbi:MAG: hypothetical protein FK731_08935 [Asgard group archaeon]|nr:hypothetical protein [Asgard group archaeon]